MAFGLGAFFGAFVFFCGASASDSELEEEEEESLAFRCCFFFAGAAVACFQEKTMISNAISLQQRDSPNSISLQTNLDRSCNRSRLRHSSFLLEITFQPIQPFHKLLLLSLPTFLVRLSCRIDPLEFILSSLGNRIEFANFRRPLRNNVAQTSDFGQQGLAFRVVGALGVPVRVAATKHLDLLFQSLHLAFQDLVLGFPFPKSNLVFPGAHLHVLLCRLVVDFHELDLVTKLGDSFVEVLVGSLHLFRFGSSGFGLFVGGGDLSSERLDFLFVGGNVVGELGRALSGVLKLLFQRLDLELKHFRTVLSGNLASLRPTNFFRRGGELRAEVRDFLLKLRFFESGEACVLLGKKRSAKVVFGDQSKGINSPACFPPCTS